MACWVICQLSHPWSGELNFIQSFIFGAWLLSSRQWPEPHVRRAGPIYLGVQLCARLPSLKQPRALGNTSLVPNCHLVSGRWRRGGKGSLQFHSGLCQQQTRAMPHQLGQPRPTASLQLLSWEPDTPNSYRAVRRRLFPSSSVPVSAVPLCQRAQPAGELRPTPCPPWQPSLGLQAEQAALLTPSCPSASRASLGCYSVIGTISPVPDTDELHLG